MRCAMFTGDGPAAATAAAAAVGIAEENTHWSLLPEDKLAMVRSAIYYRSRQTCFVSKSASRQQQTCKHRVPS